MRLKSLQTLTRLMVVGVPVFLALQFVRPAISHPPVTAELQAPPEVKQILRNSCYNCHSNEPKLAWFDQIVPAYWIVANDVKQARMHLNFSELGAQPPAAQKGALYEAVNQIQFGAMPLPSYRRVHPGAVVTTEQLAVLRAYLHPPTAVASAAHTDVTSAAADTPGNGRQQVSPELNGIAFIPGYQNWKAVSSTDRFDNNSIRAVLGNETAIKAIAGNHINPWPDGTTFAKVAWQQLPDGQGGFRTGAFIQVEFMIKDRQKYASTLGWGFARWRGVDLKPYGKDAAFAEECVGCHKPLRASDYAFTTPVPSIPPQSQVIASFVDPLGSTMSTLFGNDLAVRSARAGSQHAYPAGSVLSLVTWTQREDPRWFGARIPASPKSVESITVGSVADKQNQRAAYLLSQRASVMP